MRKKIIGFDSWLGGSEHFERLVPALSKKNIDFRLIHLSSWGNDPKCTKEGQIGKMNVRDIAFYNNSMEKLIYTEQPDAVVLLSTDTFAHRAFMRYCQKYSIPTLHLCHAIESVFGQDGNKEGVPRRRIFAHIGFVYSKLGKLFKYTFSCYIMSLLKTKASVKDWTRFISDIFQLAIGNEPACEKAANDARATKVAVYISADVERELNCYGFEEKDVFVVGNPDISHFGLTKEMIGSWVPTVVQDEKFIMYIETGLSSQATMYAGTKGFLKHLLKTSDALRAQGFKMRLKLKPNLPNTDRIVKGLMGSEIELVSNTNFISSLKQCYACICETSSLALIPTLFGIPVLLAKYGDLATLSFSSVLIDYPRSYKLSDISEVSDILNNAAQISNEEDLNDWIENMSGPLPADKMPERVVSIIEDMIESAI